MCGIFCSLIVSKLSIQSNRQFSSFVHNFSCDVSTFPAAKDILIKEVERRGPTFPAGKLSLLNGIIELRGAVLSLRGEHTPQPLIGGTGNVICWNGEIFSKSFIENGDISDTRFVLSKLSSASSDVEKIAFLDTIEGPFSIFYFDAANQSLLISRDKLGRRSLTLTIIPHPTDSSLVEMLFSSTSIITQENSSFSMEISPSGPFCINFSSSSDNTISCEHYPWPSPPPFTLPSFLSPLPLSEHENNKEQLCTALSCAKAVFPELKEAVSARIFTTRQPKPSEARVAVLFSGGLDSSIIAALCCDLLVEDYLQKINSPSDIPTHRPVLDLISVAFQASAPDRLTGLLSFAELRKRHHADHIDIRFICSQAITPSMLQLNGNSDGDYVIETDRLQHLLGSSSTLMDASIGSVLFVAARGKGRCLKNEFWTSIENNSSGLENEKNEDGGFHIWNDPLMFLEAFPDCSVDTAEGGAVHLSGSSSTVTKDLSQGYSGSQKCSIPTCPLKTSEGRCIHNACKLCCLKLRKFKRLMDAQADYSSSKDYLAEEWMKLFPSRSKTPSPPLNLENNFYASCPSHTTPEEKKSAKEARDAFVTQAERLILSHISFLSSEESETAAQVLLTGQGADELFGGYGRHREAMRKGGVEALREELKLDLGRLWLRNLGRDDRLLSAHGREARQPFLAENLSECVAKFPPNILVGEGGKAGEDKVILRVLAKEILGLHVAAKLSKRAMQFGSRSSRMFEKNEKEEKVSKKGKGKIQAIFD